MTISDVAGAGVARGKVWITRARPGAEATAGRVAELGLEPLVLPLLEVRAVGGEPIDLTAVGAVALTSANAAQAFAARTTRRDLAVFAVGEATARAAQLLGFTKTRSAGGDVAALGALIADDPAHGGVILIAGAAEPAGDLLGDLATRGIAARRATLYETAPTALSPADLHRALAADVAMLHSPKAARILATLLAGDARPRLALCCLSQAVAAPFAGLVAGRVEIASHPTDADLLACVVAVVGIGGAGPPG